MEWNLQMYNKCKPLTNSDESNESDIQEGSSCAKCAFQKFRSMDTGRYIIAERNRQNEATTNHECQFTLRQFSFYETAHQDAIPFYPNLQ